MTRVTGPSRYALLRLRDRVDCGVHCGRWFPRGVPEEIAQGATAVTPFGAYVHFHGEKLRNRYGEERLERMFAHRSLLDAGVTVAGASDHPCGPYEPLVAMQSCVTRRSSEGRTLGTSQRITAREALTMYTTGSAQASGQASVKGILAPGYLADYVVLGEDPLKIPPTRLAEMPILATIIGGEDVRPPTASASTARRPA